MSPAERIVIVKETAKKLAQTEDWADIDLTLRVFDLPWTDSWDNNYPSGNAQETQYRYCLDMLERGDATRLLALSEYLSGASRTDAEPSSLQDITGPWQPQRFKLFMSHITKDKKMVSEVKSKLMQYGIDSFVAHEDIEPTKEWMDEIVAGLDTCDALTAFITEDFHASKWTDQEVGYCIRRRVLIVPLGLGSTPYGFMGKYQGLQCKNLDSAQMADKIFDILVKNPKSQARMEESLVDQLEDSKSFDQAAARAKLLTHVKNWSPELLRKLQSTLESNSQVSGSFVAEPIVKKILKDNTF